ncbi:MAG: xanthine dehydrogenase family protein molybdopterin-binding subunit, partial [Thermodesulfobacteriota bacterium]
MEEEKGSYYTEGLSVPETPEPGEVSKPWDKTAEIGTRRPRVDAFERVSGSAIYPSDLNLPDMLYGSILRCPYPHARIRKVNT